MSLRSLAICALAGLFLSIGCDTKEPLVSVQHNNAWQRHAGKSPKDALEIAKRFDQNTKELKDALATDNDAREINEKMRGKLVMLDGELISQTDSTWTLKTSDGWTIIAPVNDLTPNADTPKDKIAKTVAQGSVQMIDIPNRTIQLNDVELALSIKSPMSENVVTK